MKRGVASSPSSSSKAHRRRADTLDAPLVEALRASPRPFLPASEAASSDMATERVVEAVRVASSNPALECFGVDGTGVLLGVAAAQALGALRVRALVFPLELSLSAPAQEAFIRQLGRNRCLRSITLSSTNLDAAADGPDERWSPRGSAFVEQLQALRRETGLPELEVLGDEAFAEGVDNEEGGEEEGEEEEGEGGEGEEEDFVQCDRRQCRREMTSPTEIVFTNKFGQDYCAACAAGMEPRPDLRQSTVAVRLAEG